MNYVVFFILRVKLRGRLLDLFFENIILVTLDCLNEFPLVLEIVLPLQRLDLLLDRGHLNLLQGLKLLELKRLVHQVHELRVILSLRSLPSGAQSLILLMAQITT